MSELIPSSQLNTWIKKVPEWELDGKRIVRSFDFDSFIDSVDFVNGVAEIAEDLGHHPDVDIRYGKVDLYITTHSAGGLTEADFELASKIDTLME